MDPYALFESIAVTEEGAKRIEMAREAFAQLVKALDMPSAQRETSIALTKLQEAIEMAREAFAQLVKALDMPSAQRETSIALTKLQEASDWAVRSYAVASRKEG